MITQVNTQRPAPETSFTSSASTASTGPSGSPETPGRLPGEAVLDATRAWLATYVLTATPEDLDLLTLWATHTHLCN